MEYTKGDRALDICTEALRAAEMRQGCTNHSYYAEILLKQLALPELYEALKAVYQDIELQNVEGGSDELNITVQEALEEEETERRRSK